MLKNAKWATIKERARGLLMSGCLFIISGFTVWLLYVFRNPTVASPLLFPLSCGLFVAFRFFRERIETLEVLVFSGVLVTAIFMVTPSSGKNFLVVIPEKGGVSQARVIKDIGFLEHPFSDKLVSVHLSYAVEADVSINTDDGKKFIAQSQKKEFRVIDPIAVYHRIGTTDEAVEEHLREGIKRCFHSEMGAKQFSDMLVKKTGESFSISPRPCELGLKYYGLEPVGGSQISFANFRMADVLPIRFQIQ